MNRNPAMRLRLLPVLVAACFSGAASANPLGAQVISGQVGFAQQGNTLAITNSPGAIINWQSFSINAGETTRFIQQSADSSVLNRVVGQDPSQILGTLQSNGRVFLINPNGILFGQGARIDVNGLVASTLNISNEDFLAGRMNFRIGERAGKLVNEGDITTPNGGQVYLIAPNVENSGIIHSPRGDVLLAAGHSVQLADSANPDLHVVVSAPDNEALNLGQIVADGGKTGIYGALIKQRGIVSADSAVVGANGKIVFKASRDIELDAGSRTSANGLSGGSVSLQAGDTALVKGSVEAKGSAGKGGEVQVLGKNAGLMDGAVIDVSGKAGGGSALIGGDYQGKGTVPNAYVTYTDRNASIMADATQNGDGGKVIVWADHTARSYAHISARGGEQGGNGGFVETSGKKYLDVGSAYPDVRAPKGLAGTWLLDPEDIVITASPNNNMTPGSPFQPMSPGIPSALNVDTLVGYLQSNGNAIVDTSGGGSGAGNITIASAINANMGFPGWLELRAHNDINVNAPIAASGASLDIKLRADYDNNGSGAINVNSAIGSNGGDLDMAGRAITIGSGGAIDTGSGSVHMDADSLTLTGTIMAADVGIRALTTARAITVGSTTCHVAPCLTITNLHRINSPTIGIGNDDGVSAGPIHVAGISNTGSSAPTDRSTATTRIGLLSAAGVTQSGAIDVQELGVSAGGPVNLTNPANAVANLAGRTTSGDFDFANSQTVTVTDLWGDDYSIYGVVADAGNISLTSAAGDLRLDSYVEAAAGSVKLKAGGAIDGYGDLLANSLNAEARAGIFLNTEVSSLTAVNTDTIGSSKIHVFNSGALTVNEVRQAGNGGDIRIATGGSSEPNTSEVPVSSAAPASLTIAGTVDANGGNVFLESDAAVFGAAGSVVKGQSLVAVANTGIFLTTQVGSLVAVNMDDLGQSDINIANTGPLDILHVHQAGTAGGGITITNFGALTVAAFDASAHESAPSATEPPPEVSEPTTPGPVIMTGGGAITLTAHSPLTINGEVKSTSGAIALEAGASGSGNDNLTINAVVATAGAVKLRAGDKIAMNVPVQAGAGVTQEANTNGVAPNPGSPISNAVDETINTVNNTITASTQTVAPNSGTSGGSSGGSADEAEEGDEGNSGSALADNGAKKNDAQKMYCN